MESIHGVDVSWLHHPNKAASKDQNSRKNSTPATPPRDRRATAAAVPQHAARQASCPSAVPPSLTEDVDSTVPTTPTSSHSGSKSHGRRPSILSRSASEKVGADAKNMPRRSSWMSSISSKFSSSASTVSSAAPERSNSTASLPAIPSRTSVSADSTNHTPTEEVEAGAGSGRSSSFFSSLTRKLSATSQAGGIPRVAGKGGLCERRVLNIDPNRERCLVPEMDQTKLRKVSFCVDVEIAGGPRYIDEEDDDDEHERKSKAKDVKMKERAEGEALKNPDALVEVKDEDDETKLKSQNKSLPTVNNDSSENKNSSNEANDQTSSTGTTEDKDGLSRKKEKKKRSEEERKERKEKRRRRAEENGQIPVELSIDTSVTDTVSPNVASPSPGKVISPRARNGSVALSTPIDAKRDRPTTDPVRIYRRCCQLRETPILKRITEQLMSPNCCVPYEPGVVNCLNLTGSRLQLADMITLGDWLAVVPVKRLLLEDADLSDEGLRCILAGLLAAKRPEPTRRTSTSPKHRETAEPKYYQERSGVIEKITLKNNPRLTRVGWKHISLFLYMCRSIKAMDLSLIQFPDTIPASNQTTPSRSQHPGSHSPSQDTDAAEILSRCLSQRRGGNKLDELILSECGMTAPQIRKIVDAATVCGINRLGFAGNHLDNDGLDAVLHYLRSGVCGGLDIGGNDLRGKLGLIAESLNDRPGVTCWGLGLAGCNLDTASIKPLLPVLTKLPDLRFIDLSHNPDLCGNDNGTISLLRRYLGQMKYLKRIHLADVGMSPKQAIALADALAEGPSLAHISILENPQLSALAAAKDEASQEEACALYASYMAAVRVSSTLICIDIDVPTADNSEVVKALAKQVVAYSLRNMERFALAEATGDDAAAATLAQAHRGGQKLKEIPVPDVLMHLVGHVEGNPENHDDDDPAPDDDYIVGGTGVVKALQYVLGEKADDLRRSSVPSTPIGGNRTPRERPGSSAGFEFAEQQVKAKKMSKNLLDSARKIRNRLQPALVKEANAGNEMDYRRLLFLDQTLQSMIQRFEEEYPETKLLPPSPKAPSLGSSVTERSTTLSSNTPPTELTNRSDDEDDDEGRFRPAVSRHNSDVSLASRALAIEEGHLHKLGQRMRREVVDYPSIDQATVPPQKAEAERLEYLREKIDNISGPQLRSMVERVGWDAALKEIGANANDLRLLQEHDKPSWEAFKESQLKARMNLMSHQDVDS